MRWREGLPDRATRPPGRPTTPARPTGLVRSPTVRPPEPGAPLCRGPGEIAPRGGPGHRLPLVALMPQWRQDYPNYRPPTRATAISEMGHNRPWTRVETVCVPLRQPANLSMLKLNGPTRTARTERHRQ